MYKDKPTKLIVQLISTVTVFSIVVDLSRWVQVQFADGETLELDAGTTIGESIEGTPIVVPAGHSGEFTVEASEGL